MSDEQVGEKTEMPTQRRLEEAQQKGQIPKSPEVQTFFVLLASVCAISFTGREMWFTLSDTTASILGHLHDTSMAEASLQGYAIKGTLLFLTLAGPIVLAAMLGGVLAGGIQNRFTTTPEALGFNIERLNPTEGLKRVFSMRSAVPTAMALIKLSVIIILTYSTVKEVSGDPVFRTSVSVPRLAEFLAESSLKIITRLLLALAVIAAADYGYQWWRTWQDLMMTREELKEEAKNSEGNPQMKSRHRKLLFGAKKRRALAAISTADVVVTNPTHIAIALRYDRKTMRAPKIVARGIRKNAARIREIARQHGVPIMENKPLARLMYKHGKEGQEIPAQLYAAVAEILAWVYRNNPYRYYAESVGLTPEKRPQN
jgi:flagellar biosynthetic protein FlhB